MIDFHVISTAFRSPAKAECLASVRSQKGAHVGRVTHDYVDAAEQSRPKRATENLYEAAKGAPSGSVIALVDGDDWLAHGWALERVALEYERPGLETWLTYGSYRFADGRPGHASAYGEAEDVRTTPWRATHLKTFRAELFRSLEPSHLQLDGEWIERCVDLATMFPLVELAGWTRCAFIPDPIYVYNFASSWEHRAPREELVQEQAIARALRARPKLEQLGGLA